MMYAIDVQIVYALKQQLWQKSLKIARGATPIDVIQQSGFLNEFQELELSQLNYGIFSQRVDQNYLMNNGDRLEIYRPLTADPKSIRRELAKVGKTMSGDRSG